MWTMSSTVIMPTSRPDGSTTAAEIKAYFWNRSATSSWSRSTGIRVCSRSMMLSTRTFRGERRMVDNLHVPIGWWTGETDEHFPEIVGKLIRGAKIIDHLATVQCSAPRSGRAGSGGGGFLSSA